MNELRESSREWDGKLLKFYVMEREGESEWKLYGEKPPLPTIGVRGAKLWERAGGGGAREGTRGKGG